MDPTVPSSFIAEHKQLSLPIVFNNVNVEIKGRKILDDVSGSVGVGQLLALMGPTGAGKTTLLNVLAHRVRISSGVVSYGEYGWSRSLKRHIGVVEQDDIVFPALTVRQSLRFVALLRLSRSLSRQEKLARVETVINELKLNSCADTKVGDGLDRGISGGERKRLCIAREFITRPEIVVFDEPTSGLDSTMAKMVVENMLTLSKQGVTIISSIHQPSSHVFRTFNKLIFLDQGQVVYHGLTKTCTEPFSAIGFTCPDHFNPADFIMDLVVLGKLEPTQRQGLVNKCKQSYPQPSELLRLVERSRQTYQTTWLTQFRIICWRAKLVLWSAAFNIETLILQLGLSVVAGLQWFNLGLDESDVFLRSSLALWYIGIWQFFPLFGSNFYFATRFDSLVKEMHVNTYRLSAYFAAHSLISTLPHFFWSFLWVAIVYCFTLVHTGSFQQYLLVLLTTWLNILVIQGIALSISAGVNQNNIVTVSIVIMSFLFGYSGLLVPLAEMPYWLTWTYFADLMAHLYELMLYIFFLIPEHSYKCLDNVSTTFEECVLGAKSIQGSEVLESLNTAIPPLVATLVLITTAVVFQLLAYVCLSLGVSKRSR